MADFGTDFSAIDDIDANLSLVSGRTCLMQALLRRLLTPRGGLFYAPNYGTDIMRFVNTSTDARVIEQAIETELLQDERVDNVQCTVTIDEPADKSITGGKTFKIDLTLETAEGPFDLTASIDAITGKILLAEISPS